MKHNPTVCIYIPTYNRSEALKKAIESAQKQTYKYIEIHICDDNSNDNTENVVKEIQANDARIFYHKLNKNSGACAARNIAIHSTKAHFITGLDDDDEFIETRVEKFLTNWKDDYSFICSNFVNNHKHSNTKKTNYPKKTMLFTPQDLLAENEAGNQIFTTTEKLRSIGGFNTSVKRLQDWDTWINLSQKYGDFLRLGDPLYIMNHDVKKSTTRVSRSIKYQEALKELISRHRELYKKNPRQESIIKSEIYYCENNVALANYIALSIHGGTILPLIKLTKLIAKNINLRLKLKLPKNENSI